MSEQVPIQLIVAAFQSEDGAEEVWKQLKAAKWGGLIKIDRMAIVQRSEKNKLKIKEQGDPGGGKGAALGAVDGGIIGSIAGPLGAVVVGGATGAVVGGITAKFYDSGIPDSRLKEIGAALQPGTSAIVAVIEHKWVAELQEEMEEAGADVLTHALTEDIAKQLSEGKEMAFTVIEGEEGIAVAHVAGNEEEMEAQSVVMTAEGVEAEAIVANAEGVAAVHMVATDEGAAIEEIVVTEEGAVVAAAVTDGETVVAGAGVITAGDDEEDSDKKDDDEGAAPEGAGVIT